MLAQRPQQPLGEGPHRLVRQQRQHRSVAHLVVLHQSAATALRHRQRPVRLPGGQRRVVGRGRRRQPGRQRRPARHVFGAGLQHRAVRRGEDGEPVAVELLAIADGKITSYDGVLSTTVAEALDGKELWVTAQCRPHPTEPLDESHGRWDTRETAAESRMGERVRGASPMPPRARVASPQRQRRHDDIPLPCGYRNDREVQRRNPKGRPAEPTAGPEPGLASTYLG